MRTPRPKIYNVALTESELVLITKALEGDLKNVEIRLDVKTAKNEGFHVDYFQIEAMKQKSRNIKGLQVKLNNYVERGY